MFRTDALHSAIKAQYGSIRQFALQNDIPVSTVSRVLASDKGLATTSLETAAAICRALDVSLNDLCDETPDSIVLTANEKKLVAAYRDNESLREAFNKLASIQ